MSSKWHVWRSNLQLASFLFSALQFLIWRSACRFHVLVSTHSASIGTEHNFSGGSSDAARKNFRRTERREWWLWLAAIAVTLLLTLGVVSFIIPELGGRNCLFQTAFGPDGRSVPRRNCRESRVPSHSVLYDCRLMMVEPYPSDSPFKCRLRNSHFGGSKYVRNAARARQNRQSGLFSTEKES
jgi:hypothetical protein